MQFRTHVDPSSHPNLQIQLARQHLRSMTNRRVKLLASFVEDLDVYGSDRFLKEISSSEEFDATRQVQRKLEQEYNLIAWPPALCSSGPRCAAGDVAGQKKRPLKFAGFQSE